MCPNRIKLVYFLVTFLLPAISSGDGDVTLDAHDLYFREVLYYLYQQQYQTALTHLEVIKQETKSGQLDRDGEIIAGELNLSYGLLNKAENIFEKLLRTPGPPEIPDETWLELAKVYYAQNSIEKSAYALSHIHKPFTGTQREDYEQLNINLHIDQDRQLTNSNKFNQGTAADTRQYYSQYNLGTGLIRNNHINEGIKILDEIGAPVTDHDLLSDEIKSLKDKANTTLGFYYLDIHNPQKAVSYFEKVRLNGAYTNKALLGMGWSLAELGNLKDALAPWVELQKGDISDTAVQESLLTVPYALNGLKAQHQAMEQYNDAIGRYKKEIQSLQSKIDVIQRNGWISSNDGSHPDKHLITYQDIRDEVLDNPYLDSLATDNDFLRAVDHYNELNILKQTLLDAQWNIGVYHLHLANKQHLLIEQAPNILRNNYARSADSSKILEQLKTELTRIANTEDALALMTEKEQSQLRVLKLVNDNIADLSRLFNLGRLDDKLRIYHGIILWDITMEYDSRLKNAQQTLAGLESKIAGLSQQRNDIKNFRQENLGDTDKFDRQIALLQEKVDTALNEIDSDITIQTSKLTAYVVAVLKAQQSHLTANLGYAYTAIAQLYEVAYITGLKEDKQ